MSAATCPAEYVASRHGNRPCDLCGEPIEAGQKCLRWKWFPRGDPPMSVRVHAGCDAEAKGSSRGPGDWYQTGDEWPEEFPLAEQHAWIAETYLAPALSTEKE